MKGKCQDINQVNETEINNISGAEKCLASTVSIGCNNQSDLNKIESSTKDLNNLIPYPANAESSEKTIGPLLIAVIESLKSKGINYHMSQALIAVITMISAHLEVNITLFITEGQGANGLSFLNSVSGLIPDELKSEFSELNKQFLYLAQDLLKNKTVVAYSPDVMKKDVKLLQMLLELGVVNDQVSTKTSGSHGVSKISIKGPTSVIVLVGQTEPVWLNDFSALRLNLDINPNYIAEQLQRRSLEQNNQDAELLEKIITKEIERLEPQSVNISFLGQIISSLDQTDPESIYIFDTVEKLLEIITIINRATFATPEEAHAGYYGIEMSNIINGERKLLPGGAHTDSKDVGTTQLEATKVEFYIMYILTKGLFKSGKGSVTGNSQVVFNAIKRINLDYLRGNTLFDPDRSSERELIKTLDAQQNNNGWATILHIKENVKNVDGISFSPATIDRGVKDLQEKNLISKRKDRMSPNKFIYAINTVFVEKENIMPHPSTIQDPVYQGRTVTVQNLLTGIEETI